MAPGPQPGHLARQLQTGDVLRVAGRRGIAPAALQHVRAVEAGGLDPDEHLSVPRLGIVVLLDGELLVGDRGGSHAASCYGRPNN